MIYLSQGGFEPVNSKPLRSPCVVNKVMSRHLFFRNQVRLLHPRVQKMITNTGDPKYYLDQ